MKNEWDVKNNIKQRPAAPGTLINAVHQTERSRSPSSTYTTTNRAQRMTNEDGASTRCSSPHRHTGRVRRWGFGGYFDMEVNTCSAYGVLPDYRPWPTYRFPKLHLWKESIPRLILYIYIFWIYILSLGGGGGEGRGRCDGHKEREQGQKRTRFRQRYGHTNVMNLWRRRLRHRQSSQTIKSLKKKGSNIRCNENRRRKIVL